MLPVEGDLVTFVLSSQDRHANGIVYFAAQTTTSAASVIEVEVEAFYESEEALRLQMKNVCALRRSPGRGQYGIGVFVSGCAAACVVCVMNMRFRGEYHRLLLLLSRDTGTLRETTSASRSLSGCLGGLLQKKFTWPSQLLRRNQDARSPTRL